MKSWPGSRVAWALVGLTALGAAAGCADAPESEGEPAARVPLPAGATPLWVEAREVWGVERDALDVPTVVRWRVMESGRGG